MHIVHVIMYFVHLFLYFFISYVFVGRRSGENGFVQNGGWMRQFMDFMATFRPANDKK